MIKIWTYKRRAQFIIDDADFDKIQGFNWGISTGGYIVASDWRSEDKAINKKVYIHRLLHEFDLEKGMTVDHINGDKLDNRRSNLRIASYSQNHANKSKSRGTSKYKGVHLGTTAWVAQIRSESKRYHLGSFQTQEEAALAYDQKALELFGEFAFTNF